VKIDPNVYSDYRKAKSEAGKLAIAMRFELGQSVGGKPQVRTTTGRLKPFKTWLSAFTWLYAVWLDRQPKAVCKPLPSVKEPPIPWAIMMD
jgi:hypothetical protein